MRHINPDDVTQINPFLHVIEDKGTNGEEDVDFKRLLKTERFMHTIVGAELLPEKDRKVFVVERLFVDNYNNFFLSWTLKTSDGMWMNPYHHVVLHETSYDSRRYPEDDVPVDAITIGEATFKAFRHSANEQVLRAQKRCLAHHKPIKRKVETGYNDEPVNMLGQ